MNARLIWPMAKALIGDRPEPAHGLAVVDGYAAALAVEQPERQLRQHLAGRRGLRVPPRGLAQIPLEPLAVLVQHAQIELRRGVTLLGGKTVPARRRGRIPRYALAVLELLAQGVLRRRIARPALANRVRSLGSAAGGPVAVWASRSAP